MTNATDQVAGDLAIARDPHARLEDRIAAGARLWNLINEAEGALAPLKEHLRDEARAQLGNDPGSIHLEGSGMTRAVVTVPRPSYSVTKVTDMPALKQLLGAAFDGLFEEVTTYKVRGVPASGKIASLTPEARNAALAAITQADPTPRVAFKAAGEGVEMISG